MTTPKKRTLILVITERCNLNCVYCYEHDKSARNMSFSTAKSILDKEFADDGWDGYEIQLLGGEPLLNFDLIRQIDEYVFETCGRTDTRLFIVTNGTLLTEERKAWLESRKHRVVCGLSVDGVREAHNKSRSQSFDLIDLDFFARVWPKQACRMTLHSSNIEHFAESVIFLMERGFPVSAAFAQGLDWITDEVLAVFSHELVRLTEYYLQHPEAKLVDLLDVDFRRTAVDLKDRDQHWCGAGSSLSSYDSSGRCFPCHTFASVSAGEDAERYAGVTVETLNYRVDPHCRDCVCLPVCSTCMGMNLMTRGEAGKRDHTMCLMHKARFLAASRLKYLRNFASRSGSVLTGEEFAELAGIARVQQAFGTEASTPMRIAV